MYFEYRVRPSLNLYLYITLFNNSLFILTPAVLSISLSILFKYSFLLLFPTKNNQLPPNQIKSISQSNQTNRLISATSQTNSNQPKITNCQNIEEPPPPLTTTTPRSGSPTTEEPSPRRQAQLPKNQAHAGKPNHRRTTTMSRSGSQTTEEPSPRRQAQPPKEQREKREQREQRGNEKKREKMFG